MSKKVLAMMFCGAVLAGLVGTVARATTADGAGTPPIVSFATSRIGQRIGRGECTDLVTEAFSAMGYKAMTHIPREGKGDTYSWGTKVTRRPYGKRYAAYRYRYYRLPGFPKAGHVIQFEDCTFKSANSTWNMPHHTAIVEKADGMKVTLLHQNMDGSLAKSVVRRTELDLSTKTQGTYAIYAPIAN